MGMHRDAEGRGCSSSFIIVMSDLISVEKGKGTCQRFVDGAAASKMIQRGRLSSSPSFKSVPKKRVSYFIKKRKEKKKKREGLL